MNPVSSEDKGNYCNNKNQKKNWKKRNINKGKDNKIYKRINYKEKIQRTGSVLFLKRKIKHKKTGNKKRRNANLKNKNSIDTIVGVAFFYKKIVEGFAYKKAAVRKNINNRQGIPDSAYFLPEFSFNIFINKANAEYK